MNANLDGAFLMQDKNKCVLEIKTTTIQNRDMLKEWGYWDNEHGVWIERIPDAYYCQVLHYLIVTGFDKAIIYAMLDFAYKDGQETREITIHRNDVIEDMQYIIEEERKFWKMLENNTPPPFMKMNFR